MLHALLSSLLYEHQGEGRLNQGNNPKNCLNNGRNSVFFSILQAMLELYADGPYGNRGISNYHITIV